ncbi:hypothetical protein [Nocardia sp. NPDC050175]|uniref:hypothetical protein n=1 Tax=Nocardia sp. NPDC050175 TaxID=3364317 RepID=UPI0037B870F8
MPTGSLYSIRPTNQTHWEREITFEELHQQVTVQAERSGYAVRRRNRAPYGFELINEHGDIPASGTLAELDSYLADQWEKTGSDRQSR